MPPSSTPSLPPRSLPAVLALAAVLAVWIDLSPIHRFHNSDSLVPILMSLDRWAPFYWEQNRFGMLVPLLAIPVRDPFANLLVQVGLRLFALVACFFLLARTVVPRPWWPAVGALTFGLFVLGKDLRQENFLQMQPYFQAMALALAGVLLLERNGAPRKIAGAALFGLAFWVAPVALFWLVPLLALRRLLVLEGGGLKSLLSWQSLLPIGLAVLAFVGSLLGSRLSPYPTTNLGAAPPKTWPRAWMTLAEKGAEVLGPWLPAAIVLLLLAALVRRRKGVEVKAALCLLGIAAAEVLILGTSGWIQLNAFKARYISTALLATATAGPALLLGLVLEGRPERWGRMANVLAFAALLPLAFWRFGVPSAATARAALADGPGAAEAREVVAGGCTHVLGDYWRVWASVFQARVLLHERGEARKVWGIAFRSTPTWRLWQPRDWHRARIAAFGSPRRIEVVRLLYRIPPFGDPRGPSLCTARPMVSFRGFRGSPCAVHRGA